MPPTAPYSDNDDGTDMPAARRKAPDMPRSDKPARAVAPWVRTRLRTAPWAAASSPCSCSSPRTSRPRCPVPSTGTRPRDSGTASGPPRPATPSSN